MAPAAAERYSMWGVRMPCMPRLLRTLRIVRMLRVMRMLRMPCIYLCWETSRLRRVSDGFGTLPSQAAAATLRFET